MKNRVLAIGQFLCFAVTILVNALANILPINGLNTGEVSALYPNQFVPAGFTFSIWGVIYLLLMVYVIGSGWLLWNKGGRTAYVQHILALAPLFMLTCVLNATWIFAWHYLQLVVSLLIMIAFLYTLIRMYRLMQSHRSALTGFRALMLYIPFVVYLAWICVATIANTTALLVHVEWSGWGVPAWAWSCGMIATAVLLSVWFGLWQGEWAYGLVIAWALWGIYNSQSPAEVRIGYTAAIGIIAALVTAVVGFVKRSRRTPLEGII